MTPDQIKFTKIRFIVLAVVIPIMVLALMTLRGGAQTTAQTGVLKLPAYRKAKLPNGLTVLLMENHDVPLISFELVIKAGSTSDPAGAEGTASFAAAMLRRGTQSRSAEQYSGEIDFVGQTFGAGSGSEATTISSEFMKKDLVKGLELFTDPILHPTFPATEFTKLMAQRTNNLRATKDSAAGVIGIYFNGYLLGAHPYARPTSGDDQSLPHITRDSVAKFYADYYRPGNAVLAVVGDFNSADMEKLLTSQFSTWSAGAITPVKVAEPTPVTGKRLLLVDKPDATQTYFRIGNVGISRTNPDRIYVQVINTLFGGRFTSMINSALRIDSGLTYGANSSFDQRRAAGPFYINSYTRNETTEKAMDMALEVLKRFHEKGITPEQLASAKAYLKGQYPRRMETSDQLAGMITELELYGLDAHDVDDFYAKVDSMTMADAQRIIQKYFPMDNLVFVVVGKASEIGPVVKKYAPQMDTRLITDPGYWPAPATH